MTKMIRIKEVMEMVGLSKSMIYQLIARNQFPAQYKIGSCSVWSVQEIEEWLQEKIMAPGFFTKSNYKD